MNKKVQVRAQSAPWHSGVEIVIRDGMRVGTNITMETVEEGSIVNPTMKITRETAQLLFDDLWYCGFRPSGGVHNEGQLKATQDHLKDMTVSSEFPIQKLILSFYHEPAPPFHPTHNKNGLQSKI